MVLFRGSNFFNNSEGETKHIAPLPTASVYARMNTEQIDGETII